MTFSTIQIPRDEASIFYHLKKYRDFRLLALKTSPEAFGSTLTRELAFTENVWYDRLSSPEATNFITTESDRIVCTLTTIGPLPYTVEESSPIGDPRIAVKSGAPSDLVPLHYRFNGMFTLPEARGKGVAKAIVKKAIEVGVKEAAAVGREYTASIVVNADNTAATALYKNCGFVSVRKEEMPPTARLVILMKYSNTLKPEELDGNSR